jgi:hypothetical protein
MAGGKGHFGVIIAGGAARGGLRTMDSFRAEACGFIAGISLLKLLTHDHAACNPKDTTHTESASLLARLKQATSDCVPAGFWLKPDSEIIMQLVEETKTANGPQQHYVKGHQDLVKEQKDFHCWMQLRSSTACNAWLQASRCV